LADYAALQGEFVRARLEAVASQAKAIGELAQKTAVDSRWPVSTPSRNPCCVSQPRRYEIMTSGRAA